jgi:hypothetical protein
MNTEKSQCFSGFSGKYLFLTAVRKLIPPSSIENFSDIFLNSTPFYMRSNCRKVSAR